MKLKAHIVKRGISVAEFGRRVGVPNRMTMLHYVNGRVPPPAVIEAIERESGGEVMLPDFYSDESGQDTLPA